MSEVQPDMLGGKDRSARSLPRVRRGATPRIVPAGHADKPGTGPAGETCAGCHWMTTFHYRKTYQKCGARPGDTWKGGRATDIRPMDAACSKFQRLANRLPAQAPSAPAPAPFDDAGGDRSRDVIASLGTGFHRIGGYDILIAPAVKTPPRHREEDDGRQISLFD